MRVDPPYKLLINGVPVVSAEEAPPLAEVWPQLLQATARKTVIAYNSDFDHSTVVRHARRDSGHLRGMVRGTSADHASIHLADLVAGAGRAVAHFHHGQAGSAAKVGEFLAPVPLSAHAAGRAFRARGGSRW